MCSEKLKGLVIKKISVFLVSALAYFVGAWLFAATFQRCKDQDQRFFVVFLLMPIVYVCFTILLLLFNKHIIGIQSACALQLSAGAFIGLSAFLLSLDGVGSLVHSDSFSQLLSQFSVPAIGALVVGGVALGFSVFTQAPHQGKDQINCQQMNSASFRQAVIRISSEAGISLTRYGEGRGTDA